jgi:hypothetical protein
MRYGIVQFEEQVFESHPLTTLASCLVDLLKDYQFIYVYNLRELVGPICTSANSNSLARPAPAALAAASAPSGDVSGQKSITRVGVAAFLTEQLHRMGGRPRHSVRPGVSFREVMS